jgi:uncharacterized lipoprotein YddW (UPF0748 family)
MSKKNILFAIFIFLWCSFTLCPFNILDAASSEKMRTGVWVTVFSRQEVLHSKENINRLIETCKKSGIDDIYIQIYRADKAYYDSGLTDRTAYEKILSEAGEDTLACLIVSAKDNGLKVHAWINLLSVAQNKDANILKKFGKEILTIDQHGRSSMPGNEKDKLDKYYVRENQLFLEPGDRRVREYLAGIAEEIVTKYPQLSGLHLDYVRYPAVVPFVPGSRFTSHGISYGYGSANAGGFKNATGIDVKTMEHSRENFKQWDEWRREQVTGLVQSISGRVRKLSPSMEISGTIVPSVERTYLTTLQDWTEWLRLGYADYVVAMNYTDDTRLMELNSGSLLIGNLDKKVHIGIGAYLLKGDTKTLKAQLESLRKISPAGIVVFSYDDIAGNKEIQKLLADELRSPLPQN